MNNKARYLHTIVSVVVECCVTEIGDGEMSLSEEDVLGQSRAENVVMCRSICVMLMVGAGYSITTIAQLFHRTPHAIRHLLEVGHRFHVTSRAFQIASAEATLRCRDISVDDTGEN